MAKKKKADVGNELLAGLTFRTTETRTVDEDGKRVARSFPIERPLTEDDVLDMKDLGDTVVLVAADGRKHRVAKPAAKQE